MTMVMMAEEGVPVVRHFRAQYSRERELPVQQAKAGSLLKADLQAEVVQPVSRADQRDSSR